MLVLDLWPPGNFDPSGIHGALWAMVGGTSYLPSTDRPLTLAAYAVSGPGLVTAYVAGRGRGTAGYAVVSGARTSRQCAFGGYVLRGLAGSPRTLAAGD